MKSHKIIFELPHRRTSEPREPCGGIMPTIFPQSKTPDGSEAYMRGEFRLRLYLRLQNSKNYIVRAI